MSYDTGPGRPGTLGGMSEQQAILELQRLGYDLARARHAVEAAALSMNGRRHVIGGHLVTRELPDGYRIGPYPDPGSPAAMTAEQAAEALALYGYPPGEARDAVVRAAARHGARSSCTIGRHRVVSGPDGYRIEQLHADPGHLERYEGIPLTAEQALTGLTHLGYPPRVARMAVDHAPYTQPDDGGPFLGRHRVTAEDGTYIISRVPPESGTVSQGAALRELIRRGHRPWPDLERDRDVDEILTAVILVDDHLDEAAPAAYRDNPLANRWRRIAGGPASEGQEAVDALNLATGGNPRKGVTGDDETILGELGDAAVASLLAIQSVTKDGGATWAVFIAALAKALSRVPGERPEPPRSLAHFPPESGMDDQDADDNGITG